MDYIVDQNEFIIETYSTYTWEMQSSMNPLWLIVRKAKKKKQRYSYEGGKTKTGLCALYSAG